MRNSWPLFVFGAIALAVTAALSFLTPASALFSVLSGVNVALFTVFGIDKAFARFGPEHGTPGGHRAPEISLLGLAALGAAPGAWIAMLVFRHKTQKTRFHYGIPALAVIELIVLSGLAWRFPGMLWVKFLR